MGRTIQTSPITIQTADRITQEYPLIIVSYSKLIAPYLRKNPNTIICLLTITSDQLNLIIHLLFKVDLLSQQGKTIEEIPNLIFNKELNLIGITDISNTVNITSRVSNLQNLLTKYKCLQQISLRLELMDPIPLITTNIIRKILKLILPLQTQSSAQRTNRSGIIKTSTAIPLRPYLRHQPSTTQFDPDNPPTTDSRFPDVDM